MTGFDATGNWRLFVIGAMLGLVLGPVAVWIAAAMAEQWGME